MSAKQFDPKMLFLLGGIGAILTGTVAVLSYINSKELKKLQQSNAELDKELKLFDLELKKNELSYFNKTF
jgi:hypothetical protein